jgi:hypothetical protein
MLGFWVLIFFAFVTLMVVPWWPFSRRWGYAPAGLLGALLLLWFAMIWFGLILFAWPWTTPVAVAPPA